MPLLKKNSLSLGFQYLTKDIKLIQMKAKDPCENGPCVCGVCVCVCVCVCVVCVCVWCGGGGPRPSLTCVVAAPAFLVLSVGTRRLRQ